MRTALLFAMIAAAGMLGCNSDNSVAPQPMTDQQAVQQQAATVDSVAEFSGSDEATIDDNGLKEPNYDGSGQTSPPVILPAGNPADSLPVRWGRHIDWQAVIRDYQVTMVGDTSAIVLVTKTIPGEFLVAYGMRSADSILIDTVVHKPFIEHVQRRVLFRRIAHTAVPLWNWIPVAITLVQGKTETAAQFSVTSLEINDPSRSYDTSFIDPLNSWLKLGVFRGSVPRFTVGDSIDVKVTITSADDSTEIVTLRHSVEVEGLVHRVVMNLVAVSGGPGNYTRVYEKRFRAGVPIPAIAARFNAVVDVISHGSLFSKSDSFANEFWGTPYIVIR